MNLNKAQIIGRITQPLELKTTKSGVNILSFSVATNYVYKDTSGDKVENTTFHNIVSFGKQAETIAQYFIKGQEIYVEGRLQTQSWEDEVSKKKLYKTEIVLEKFEFGQKPKGVENQAPANSSTDGIDYPEEEINPEDIPF